MKRTLVALTSLVLIFLSAPITLANTPQKSSVIVLTEPSHRQINGQFIDDGLAASIAGTGRLGQLIFDPPSEPRTWIIDPALVQDVVAMSQGYTLTNGVAGTGKLFAQTWLSQLKHVTKNDTVIAMAYSDPSEYWVKRFSPHEANYILDISQSLLSSLLNRDVAPALNYFSTSDFTLSNSDIQSIETDASNLSVTAPYIDPTTIDKYRLGLIKILNPNLTVDRREYLIRDLTANAFSQIHLVHLSPGKFTITSSHQSIPITLTNGFPNSVKVNLDIFPTNAKVSAPSATPETIPAQSKIQVMVPLSVLTSGVSGLNVSVTSPQGAILGDPVIYDLKLAVISPVATWITTGSAILLFVAAAIQSVRRIRRRSS